MLLIELFPAADGSALTEDVSRFLDLLILAVFYEELLLMFEWGVLFLWLSGVLKLLLIESDLLLTDNSAAFGFEI